MPGGAAESRGRWGPAGSAFTAWVTRRNAQGSNWTMQAAAVVCVPAGPTVKGPVKGPVKDKVKDGVLRYLNLLGTFRATRYTVPKA